MRAPDTLFLDGTVAGQSLRLQKTGMSDAVVWNPWVAKAKAPADFGDAEDVRMRGVESGAIHAPPALPPGAEWAGAPLYTAAAG